MEQVAADCREGDCVSENEQPKKSAASKGKKSAASKGKSSQKPVTGRFVTRGATQGNVTNSHTTIGRFVSKRDGVFGGHQIVNGAIEPKVSKNVPPPPPTGRNPNKNKPEPKNEK